MFFTQHLFHSVRLVCCAVIVLLLFFFKVEQLCLHLENDITEHDDSGLNLYNDVPH